MKNILKQIKNKITVDMKTARNILIYLVGYVLSYLILKQDIKLAFNDKYSTGDRCFNLLWSAGSWVSVGAATIVYGIEYFANQDNDTPANW